MEVIRDLLREHLPKRIYVGKSKDRCYSMELSFEQGYVEWRTHGATLTSLPKDSSETYFDSFFGFTDYMESINAICYSCIQSMRTIERVNKLAILLKKYFPWCQFAMGCEAVLPITGITEIEHKRLAAQSFVRYLQQIIPIKRLEDIASDGSKSMKYLLRQLSTGDGRICDLDTTDVDLDGAVKLFYEKYVNEWAPKLKTRCQVTDKNDIGTAMLIGAKCSIPSLAVHRYLVHRDNMADRKRQQEHVRNVMVTAHSDATVNK
jgi:hypothetical protein